MYEIRKLDLVIVSLNNSDLVWAKSHTFGMRIVAKKKKKSLVSNGGKFIEIEKRIVMVM